MLVGLIMIYQIGSQTANVSNNLHGTDYSSNFFFLRQLRNVVLSLVAFFIAFKVPYDLLKKYSVVLFGAGIFACLVLAITGKFGIPPAQCSLGACRWIDLGFINFQPSELLKLGMLTYLATFLGAVSQKGEINHKENLIKVAVITGVSLFFVVILQKDLGTGVSIGLIALVQLFILGVDKKILFFIIAAALLAGALFIVMEPHRIDRIKTFLQDDSTQIEDDGSYHITNAKVAIGSGGLFGVGIGNSLQATGYLPEPTSDSIFAIMGETFGFIGLMIVIVMFTILMYRLLKGAYFLHDTASRLIVAGVFAWIASHFFINIMAMVGVIPLTGITLPFLSSGGTSMIFIATGLGLAFHLSSYTAHTPSTTGPQKISSVPARRRATTSTNYTGRRGK